MSNEEEKKASDIPSENRREHARFELQEHVVALTRSGGDSGGDNLADTLLDLSEGGFKIAIKEGLPSGSRVRFVLTLPKYSDQVEAEGEVCWCLPLGETSDRFVAGVRFTEIDPVQAKKVSRLKNWLVFPKYEVKRTILEKPKSKEGDDESPPPGG